MAELERPSLIKKGDIDTLKYNFDYGARSNLWHVDIKFPDALGGKSIPEMGLRCTSATLPGKEISTTDWNPGLGSPIKRVNGVSNDNTISLKFLCDTSFTDRIILETWFEFIFGQEPIQPGGDNKVQEGNSFSAYKGNSLTPVFAYYDDYAKNSRITIYQFRKDMNTALKCTLFDAFPISYKSQDLDREDGKIMEFEIDFAFSTFFTEYSPPPKRSALNRGRAILDAFLGVSNIAGRFSDSADRFTKRLSRFENTIQSINNLTGP